MQAQRSEFILKELQLGKPLKVTELSQRLQVSVDTVRRDLKALDASGLIKYVRGGACLPDALQSFSHFKGREIINSDLKREAARKAVSFVTEGAVVALNSGTTNTILAQELLALNFSFTVVTNNLAAANILLGNDHIELYAIGGRVDLKERSTCGSQCVKEFSEYMPDLAFLSVNAVNLNEGFTDFRFNEIPVMQALARNSKRVIAVLDSSKLNKLSKKKALELNEADVLVTDSRARGLELYAKAGLSVS